MTGVPRLTRGHGGTGRARLLEAIALLSVIVVAALAGWIEYRQVFAWPRGDLIGRSTSPDGRWVVSVYYLGHGDQPDPPDWRVETSQAKGGSGQARHVYFGPPPSADPYRAQVTWQGDTRVTIAGKTLDLRRKGSVEGTPFTKLDLLVNAGDVLLAAAVVLGTSLLGVVVLHALLSRRRRPPPTAMNVA